MTGLSRMAVIQSVGASSVSKMVRISFDLRHGLEEDGGILPARAIPDPSGATLDQPDDVEAADRALDDLGLVQHPGRLDRLRDDQRVARAGGVGEAFLDRRPFGLR